MSGKFEDEIRDLLEKMDDFVAEGPRARRVPRRSNRLGDRIGRALVGARHRLAGLRSPQQLVILGILLVVVALFVRAIVPIAGNLIGAAGILLFAIGYVLSVAGRGRGRQQTRWRGQVIEFPQRRPWWYALVRRFMRKR